MHVCMYIVYLLIYLGTDSLVGRAVNARLCCTKIVQHTLKIDIGYWSFRPNIPSYDAINTICNMVKKKTERRILKY